MDCAGSSITWTTAEGVLVVSGTHGYLTVPDFVLPFFGSEAAFEVNAPVFRVHGCDFNMEPRVQRIAVNEYSNSTPNAQEANLFRNFAAQVQAGGLNSSWPDMALQTQRVMEACYTSARSDGAVVEVK